jgi:hypothetical protein
MRQAVFKMNVDWDLLQIGINFTTLDAYSIIYAICSHLAGAKTPLGRPFGPIPRLPGPAKALKTESQAIAKPSR